MARRAGIEISSTRCAIVDVDLPRQRSARGAVRVRAFKTVEREPGDEARLVRTLRQMRVSRAVSSHAVVAVWGVRSAHQVLSLPPARPADLGALALREAAKMVPLLTESGEASTTLLLGTAPALPGARKDVALVAASAADIRAALSPIIAAGYVIDAVVTVPMALSSLARRLHPHAAGASAYIAVNGDATALAIVRDGLPVFAREIPMTFPAAAGTWPSSQKIEFADRLAAELRRSFLFFKQQSKLDVEQVFVCGAFPDLRALTAPLIHGLDVEVQTLDSMDGLSAPGATGADIDIRERAGALRVAWAAAADRSPDVDLSPVDAAARRDSQQFVRRLGIGVSASLLLLLVLYGLAQAWAARAGARADALRREAEHLASQVQRIEAAQREGSRNAARAAMLEAAGAQGPRLARVFERLSQSVSGSVVLDSVVLGSDGAVWKITVKGRSAAGDAAAAQAAFNEFLRRASALPYLGAPIGEPTWRVQSDATASIDDAATRSGAGGVVTRPAEHFARSVGLLDFSVRFGVRK